MRREEEDVKQGTLVRVLFEPAARTCLRWPGRAQSQMDPQGVRAAEPAAVCLCCWPPC